MSPRVKAALKVLFVGCMIYYVTTLITFEDRLVFRQGQEVVEQRLHGLTHRWW